MKVFIKFTILTFLATLALIPLAWASDNGEMDCYRVRAALGLTN